MRSTRSSNNIDHESRRNDYSYHHSSRSSSNHADSNGYGNGGNNNNEYRLSKRSSSNITPSTPTISSSLIKRMKSSSMVINNNSNVNGAKENNRDHPNQKSSTNPLKATAVQNFSLNIDPNECHQRSYNGCDLEEIQALSGDSLVDNAKMALDQFSDSTGLMLLLEMRNLNRMDKYRVKEARQRYNASKEKVDKIHLQLQNLQYEVVHLQKEQKTCTAFRSKDEMLELVESNRFYISDHVPEHLRHLIVVSNDKTTATLSESATNDERHKLHLARLDWELKQRVSSEKELKLAEESRFRLEAEISAKRQTLAQFDPTLKNIIEASKPLVSQLNVPLQVYDTSNQLTPYLPQALYVLYIQLMITFTFYSKIEMVGINYTIENITNSNSVESQFCMTDKESNVFSKLLASDDTGLRSPNPAVEYLLKRHDIESFESLIPHIDQQPIVSSDGTIRVKSSIVIDSLDKTIKAIYNRFQARINLQEQVIDIVKTKLVDMKKFESLLDTNEMFDDFDMKSLKPNCSIRSFDRLTSELFIEKIETLPILKRRMVEYFDCDDNESSNDMFDSNNFFFKLIIANNSTNENDYVLCATIIVPHNYPQRWPFFVLNFESCPNESSYLDTNWLRSLEEHINVILPHKVYQQAIKAEAALYPTTLLLRQIYDVQVGLDVISDARRQLSHKSSQSMEVYSGPRCVNSFTSMSIVQGRDHSLKFF
ncbi:THO complex subunit 5 [Blomia tropicalis]|nr:THO complex subunit 5 [Blomia tropicalis]